MTTNRPNREELLANLHDPDYDATEGIAAHGHAHDSVRRFQHAGHDIEIHTHYRIIIDGKEFPDQLQVAGDGTVHYHGYPQYRAPSAVQVVKRIAEDFLENTPPPVDAPPPAQAS